MSRDVWWSIDFLWLVKAIQHMTQKMESVHRPRLNETQPNNPGAKTYETQILMKSYTTILKKLDKRDTNEMQHNNTGSWTSVMGLKRSEGRPEKCSVFPTSTTSPSLWISMNVLFQITTLKGIQTSELFWCLMKTLPRRYRGFWWARSVRSVFKVEHVFKFSTLLSISNLVCSLEMILCLLFPY